MSIPPFAPTGVVACGPVVCHPPLSFDNHAEARRKRPLQEPRARAVGRRLAETFHWAFALPGAQIRCIARATPLTLQGARFACGESRDDILAALG